MDPSTDAQHEGEDEDRLILVMVDDEARVIGLTLDPEWTAVVGEARLGDALVSAQRAAVSARDAAQLAETDVASLLRRLSVLTSMSREELTEHVGGAVPDAPWRSHGSETNVDLLDPGLRAEYSDRLRQIHQEPDEVTSGDGLLRMQGVSGRPTGLDISRGWGTRYGVQHQATQLFDLLVGLQERHDTRLGRLEEEFPGLGARQQDMIDRGLSLVRGVPLPEESDGQRGSHG